MTYRFSWVAPSVYFRNFIIICKLLFLVNQISRWISARCLPSNLWFLHFGSPADSYSVYELKRLQWRYDAKPNMIARSRRNSWWSVVGLSTALNDLNGHQTTTSETKASRHTTCNWRKKHLFLRISRYGNSIVVPVMNTYIIVILTVK